MKHKKEITMPDFGEAVNVSRVKDFSPDQLKALDKDFKKEGEVING